MNSSPPSVIVLAGPNGAGKTTASTRILQGALQVDEFVNADVIARGLSGFNPERAALSAGRIMLSRLRELSRQRATFAFETTLASRSFAPWIEELVKGGYRFELLYLWLDSPELAIRRVRERASMGGHSVPEETIRRRYFSGLKNFFELYRPLATHWRFYDNSACRHSHLIASGRSSAEVRVRDPGAWNRVRSLLKHEGEETQEHR